MTDTLTETTDALATSDSIRDLLSYVDVSLEWEDVVGVVVGSLSGDAEVVEGDDAAQFGHFASGIKVTLENDVLLLSSSYSLLGGDASIVAEQMREVTMALEMATARVAVAVRFDQPELAAGDIAGRQRVHGYAFFPESDARAHGGERTMELHASLLEAFDQNAARRNP